MKALTYLSYGSPDVLQLREVAMPTPADHEVLVRVYAAAANPLDWHFLRGSPFLMRLGTGLTKPKHPFLGADVAGIVEAVGRQVTQFKPGDAVFGDLSSTKLGAFAEYVCAPAESFVLKPKQLSFAEAAAVPVVGFTALQGLRDKGKVQRGQTVLINGASGGVGSFAVQVAKAFGAEVTGVCSGRNRELVRSIGADHVIDYTQTDFTRTGQTYDLIYDTVGNRSLFEYKRALKPQGRCVIPGFNTFARLLEHGLGGALLSIISRQQIGLMGSSQPNQRDLLTIKALIETGRVRPVIDRTYPLAEGAEAIRYLETGRARGKVIIQVRSEEGDE
jgi:NADPH:quinone reductase-like Zn-dependent oxidoreductase